MQSAIEAIPEGLRAHRVVIEATLLPNYLAASYFPSALLESADLIPIGTRPAVGTYRTQSHEEGGVPTKRLLVAGTDHSVRLLRAILDDRLDEPRRSATEEAFREFSEIRLPTVSDVVRLPAQPSEALGASDTELWEAVLHPLDALQASWDTRRESVDVYEKWRRLVSDLGGTTIDDYLRVVGGLAFVPVRLARAHLEVVAQFNPLRTIRPMPSIRPIPVPRTRRLTAERRPSLAPDTQPRSDLKVAVFDGGIDGSSPYHTRFVREIDLTPEPKTEETVEHGEVVTSALLFGYSSPGEELGPPASLVDHFRVLPDPDPADPDAYWILDQIEDVVSKNSYPLVNLSLGPDQPIDDDTPHLWTVTLDKLAYERGTLFVSAVGNSGDLDPVSERRVQPAADMVNGLGVGAADLRTSERWGRASYSSVGPGRPGARVRPTGLCFGGSESEPFVGLLGDGTFCASQGTSFATPLCVHALTHLAAELGQSRRTASTLRAFAVHFASPHPTEPLQEVGFGRIRERFDDVWQSGDSSVTVLYQDSIARDQGVALRLPWPDGIGAGRVSIRWTLAFTSATDPTDPVDYTRAGIDVVFRPHARRLPFVDSSTGRQLGVVDIDDVASVTSLLAAGARPASLPATRSPERVFPSERTLRDSGKWETTIHHRDRMLASSLFRPELNLAYLARDSGLLVRDNVPPLEYSLLVTIDGPPGLYDAVRQQYAVLTEVRPEISIAIRV